MTEEKRRYLFVDLETGGLYPTEHPLLEIGMRCEYGSDDPDAIEFSALIQQSEEDWARCNEGALRVNQLTFETCMLEGLPHYIVADKLCSWLYENGIDGETITWVGQNPDFDQKFLRHNFGTYLDFVGLFPLHEGEVINVMDLAKSYKQVNNMFKPSSLSGANISLALGLQPEDHVHRAMGGVMAVRNNFYRLMKLLSSQEEMTQGEM